MVIMLDTVFDLFTRRTPRRDAVVGLARILNQHDLANITFQETFEVDRRGASVRHVSWGVWLFPIEPAVQSLDFVVERGFPAVTQDLRREGIGILTPMHQDATQFIVAMPKGAELESGGPMQAEDDSNWAFFRCDVCHNTPVTGGWFQLGLQVTELVRPTKTQRAAFREHVSGIVREADV